MKIFIIHARRTGYGVIRSLRSYSPKIFVADTSRTPVFRSRYVTKSFLISDITKVDNDSFVAEMIALAEEMDYQEEKPVVFTGKDDYLLFFSRNYPRLSNYFDLSFESDYEVLEASLNKKRLIQYAMQAEVDIPRSYSDDDSMPDILSQTSWPLVVKPAIKNRPDRDVVNDAFRLKLCHNEHDLSEAISLLKSIDQPYVVQEYIPGGDDELYTVGTYSWKGDLKAWAISKKIRQFPPNLGECSFGVTVHEPALAEPAARLLKQAGLTGISQIEFKKYNGRYYLIEINPRIWSWHQINAEIGVNLDHIALDHIHGTIYQETIRPTPESRYWIFLTMDILHNYMLNKNVSVVRLIRDLMRSKVEAFWDIRDPLPFFVHLRETIRYMRAVVDEHRAQTSHKEPLRAYTRTIS